jgi:hypothetical protein
MKENGFSDAYLSSVNGGQRRRRFTVRALFHSSDFGIWFFQAITAEYAQNNSPKREKMKRP